MAYARTWYTVLGVSPVMELVKLPVPAPSLVQVPPMTGFADVLQQTPLSVISKPPSEVIVPPPTAVVEVILEMGVVVTIGKFEPGVEKVSSAP